MPAINFRSEFAAAVEAGRKRQTIRPLRKDNRKPCKPGDPLYLYTGLRTKNARKLGEGLCTRVRRIVVVTGATAVDGRNLTLENQYRLAIDDGFGDQIEMIRWLKAIHGLPFQGWIINWETAR